MRNLPDSLTRLLNGFRKVAAGLRPFNESVWPGVRNDLFVAHESIYRFAGRFATGRRVLDAGCGTGYGSAILGGVAAAVLGVDLDAKSIAYARRHYARDAVRFEAADMQRLRFREEFDLVMASNALEHLDDVGAFLDGAVAALRPGGLLLVAVPPIYGAADAAVHAGIHYHRSNHTVDEWHALLAARRLEVQPFVHRCVAAAPPDVRSPRRSRLTPADFTFDEVPAAELATTLSITAVFVGRRY
jgi:SAM-dependent methyltransferase